MSCNVCGTVYDGKFCPNCGAPAVAGTPISSEQVGVNQKKTKVKKPFYKKWWFWVIVAFIIIGAIGSSGDETDTSSDTGADTSISSQQDEKIKTRISLLKALTIS